MPLETIEEEKDWELSSSDSELETSSEEMCDAVLQAFSKYSDAMRAPLESSAILQAMLESGDDALNASVGKIHNGLMDALGNEDNRLDYFRVMTGRLEYGNSKKVWPPFSALNQEWLDDFLSAPIYFQAVTFLYGNLKELEFYGESFEKFKFYHPYYELLTHPLCFKLLCNMSDHTDVLHQYLGPCALELVNSGFSEALKQIVWDSDLSLSGVPALGKKERRQVFKKATVFSEESINAFLLLNEKKAEIMACASDLFGAPSAQQSSEALTPNCVTERDEVSALVAQGVFSEKLGAAEAVDSEPPAASGFQLGSMIES